MEKQQKKRTALSWVVEFAGQKRSNYILSVLLAMMKVICGLMPYVYMADIVDKLLKMHSGVIETAYCEHCENGCILAAVPYMSCTFNNTLSCGYV